MLLNILLCTLGIVTIGWSGQLPEQHTCVYVLVLSIACLISKLTRSVGFFGLGCCWALWYAYIGLERRIPDAWQGLDLRVEGVVVGLPRAGEKSQRFMLQTDAILNCNQLPIEDVSQSACTKAYRLLLNYYDSTEIRPGARWLFNVKLNRPHGQANRGTFDYEAWLFRERISATGYVRPSVYNRKLADSQWRQLTHQLRFGIRQRVMAALGTSPHVGLLVALIIGESNMIAAHDWKILSATGTNHLLVISGLHVSLVAGLVYRLMAFICRLFFGGILATRIALVIASVAVSGYGALAGFGLPVQRALIMILVVFAGLAIGRKVPVRTSFCLALFGVVALQPLAPLAPGFWLSFGAVFTLLYAFVGRSSIKAGGFRMVAAGLRAQCVIFVAMFTVTGYLILQVSLISPFANIIAIPWISLVVVPGLLLSTLSLIISDQLAGLLLQGIDQLFGILWLYLSWLSRLHWIWYPQSLGVIAALWGFCAGLMFLLPAGLPGRWLGIVLLLPAIQPHVVRPPSGQLRANILDVGQGLAVVLQTQNHAMVYDMGARYSDRFDFGSAVVIPALRVRGIKRLDRVIISNGDADHAGGARTVIDSLQPYVISTGNNIRVAALLQTDRQISPCHRGQHWSWDGVSFEILHPEEAGVGAARWQGNNRSCVLLVSAGNRRLLLTGDIEMEVEQALVQSRIDHVDVLLVPHHGSRSSSTPLFLNTLHPDDAIVSAGYRNRFQHPDNMVVKRYLNRGVRFFNTAVEGEVDVVITARKPPSIRSYRRQHPRYWR